jgi:hypothetical protein
MILGNKDRESGSRATLDDLFRRAGVRASDALALIDPPNRESFTDGAPRALTFAQADRAISALAARLCRLGLRADTVVAIQLPNTVEAVITLLAVLRAGMIAAPLPLLWRRHDMTAALRQIGARAIVTSARIGSVAHTDLAMQVAAELFPIRYVCAFGNDLPDGIVALDDVFAAHHMEAVPRSARPGNPADHVALVTFDVTAGGRIAVARSHMELIAGGVTPFLEGGSVENASVLSAIPPASFAGIALTVLPWLIGGGCLHLHHGFEPETFAAQCQTQDCGTVVLPGPALGSLAEVGHLGANAKNIVALWRSPDRLSAAAAWRGVAGVIDVAIFGETGLLAARRGADGRPAPIQHGTITAPQGASAATAVAETARAAAGTLLLRGAMVPVSAFPPGAERSGEPHLAADDDGFVDTGFPCRLAEGTLSLSGPPAGITAIGFYRFRSGEVEAQVAHADPAATVVALPDAILGQRLAGSTTDRAAIDARLQESGANPLINAAFAPRGLANVA